MNCTRGLTELKVKQPHSNSSNLMLVVLHIIAVDALFSFDSVITVVALVDDVTIIITAIVVSAVIMVLWQRLFKPPLPNIPV